MPGRGRARVRPEVQAWLQLRTKKERKQFLRLLELVEKKPPKPARAAASDPRARGGPMLPYR